MMHRKELLVASLLAAQIIQGGAAQAAPGKASKDQGKKLFAAMNCTSCHSINDVGGCMGPPLRGVSKRRSDAYLRLRLEERKEDDFIKLMKHPELFPHPRFRKAQVEQLIGYLKSLDDRTPPKPENVHSAKVADSNRAPEKFEPLKPGASSREGRRLLLATGCIACHSVYGAGGTIGPALDGIGFRRSRAYIEAHINDPQANLKKHSRSKVASKMVQEDLFPDQVQQIADFLLTLPERTDEPAR